MTYGTFNDILSDFDETLNEMKADLKDVTRTLELQTQLLETLKKYGIPNEWPEYTDYQYWLLILITNNGFASIT